MGYSEPDVIAFLRCIVAARDAAQRDGCLVDLLTAQTILAVYYALSTANRAKLAGLPLDKMAALAFRVANRAGSGNGDRAYVD